MASDFSSKSQTDSNEMKVIVKTMKKAKVMMMIEIKRELSTSSPAKSS